MSISGLGAGRKDDVEIIEPGTGEWVRQEEGCACCNVRGCYVVFIVREMRKVGENQRTRDGKE